jgi:hypothetical protein
MHASLAVRRSLGAAVFVSSLLCAGATRAQGLPEDVKATASRLHEQALAGTRAYAIARSLTVEVGPRPAGSKAYDAAVEWGLRKMKELGFSNVHAEKTTVPHWVRGEESGEIVAPYPQPVHLAALGGSVGTPASGIEAQVIEVPSLDAVAKLDPAQVKGKIVFYNAHMQRTKDIAGYAGAVPVRGAGAVVAAKLGAVAVLIRSVGTDHNRAPHTGAMRYLDGVEKIPAAALSSRSPSVCGWEPIPSRTWRRRAWSVRSLGARSRRRSWCSAPISTPGTSAPARSTTGRAAPS